MGPLVFFPLTAIQSVPFITIAICLAIRGLIIAPEKKGTFTTLLVFYGLHFLVFFYPTMNYVWMNPQTSYDGLYHFLGFFSSVFLFVIALQVANSTATTWKRLIPSVYFGCWGFQLLGAIFLIGNDMGGDPTLVSRIFYGVYALFQIIIPAIAFAVLMSTYGKQVAARRAATASLQPMVPVTPTAKQPNPFIDKLPATPTAEQPPVVKET